MDRSKAVRYEGDDVDRAFQDGRLTEGETLKLDGTNAMQSSLDMNSNDLVDTKDAFVDTLTIDGVLVAVTEFSGNNIAKTYLTVAAMIAAADLAVGDTAITQGYTTAGDGRAAVYRIVAAATGTADGVLYHDLTGITGQAEFVSGAERHRYETTDPSISNHIFDPEYNEWDTDISLSVLLASASDISQINYLGVLNAVPERYTSDGGASDPLNIAMGWGPDTGYVDGAASISSIVGGYDCVVNQSASACIASYHSMIAYGTELHNIIIGGSTCFISGAAFGASANTGRNGIINGNRCRILDGPYNTIVGGTGNEISGSYSLVNGGLDNTVGRGARNAIIGSQDCLIDNTGEVSSGDNNGCYSSQNVTMDIGSGGVAVGLGGLSSNVGPKAHASGNDVATFGGGQYYGADYLEREGDAQAVRYLMRVRTVDAANDNLEAIQIRTGSSQPIVLPAACAGTGKVKLIGMKDGSALGNNDGNYEQVSYADDFGFMYDGTNLFLFKTGTETAVDGATKELSLTQIVQANNDFTPGAAPRLRMSTNGQLLGRVNGVAATIINWVGEVELVMTRCG